MLPGRDLYSEVSVNGDGEQGEDGALSEHQHCARHQQAAVEVSLEPDTDGDGERDDQSSHSDICHSQRHDEPKSCVSQGSVYFHRPDYHHVSDD